MKKIDKCLAEKYCELLECEIVKGIEHELQCGGTSAGAAYIHHSMENLKHIKMWMSKDGGGEAMHEPMSGDEGGKRRNPY